MIPALRIKAKYDVNARILSVPLKGQGDVVANASKCNNLFLPQINLLIKYNIIKR